MEDGVRDGQKRMAEWLDVDIGGVTTAAEADAIIYNAPLPPSLVEDAFALGLARAVTLPYGAGKGPIQKARLKWSKRELAANGWTVGTLLVWKGTTVSDEPDTEGTPEDANLTPDPTLWVVSNILPEKGKVTIKPFGPPRIAVTTRGDKPDITLQFPTNNSKFRTLLVFRLRDAQKIDAGELTLC